MEVLIPELFVQILAKTAMLALTTQLGSLHFECVQDRKQEQERKLCEADHHCASGTPSSRDENGLGSGVPFSSLAARNELMGGRCKETRGTKGSQCDCQLDQLSTVTAE